MGTPVFANMTDLQNTATVRAVDIEGLSQSAQSASSASSGAQSTLTAAQTANNTAIANKNAATTANNNAQTALQIAQQNALANGTINTTAQANLASLQSQATQARANLDAANTLASSATNALIVAQQNFDAANQASQASQTPTTITGNTGVINSGATSTSQSTTISQYQNNSAEYNMRVQQQVNNLAQNQAIQNVLDLQQGKIVLTSSTSYLTPQQIQTLQQAGTQSQIKGTTLQSQPSPITVSTSVVGQQTSGGFSVVISPQSTAQVASLNLPPSASGATTSTPT
jgi:hypothetical protein